jgi:ELWxxDGT repeat protein
MRAFALGVVLAAVPAWAQLSKLVDLETQSPGVSSSPESFFSQAGNVYFFATDRHGRQLWVIDANQSPLRLTDGLPLPWFARVSNSSSTLLRGLFGARWTIFTPDAGFTEITFPPAYIGADIPVVFRDQFYLRGSTSFQKVTGTTASVLTTDPRFVNSSHFCAFEGGILSDGRPGWALFNGQSIVTPPLLPNSTSDFQCAGQGASMLVDKGIPNASDAYFRIESDGGVSPSPIDAGTPLMVSSDNRFAVMSMSTGFYLLNLVDGSTAAAGSFGSTFVGDRLFFSFAANGADLEPGFFSWDAGARSIKDTNPAGSGSPVFFDFSVGGRVFFTTADRTGTRVIWSSDGTEPNTQSLGLIPFSFSPGAAAQGQAGPDFAAFAIDLGGQSELGLSDGTPQGTRAIDLTPGTSSSNPELLGTLPQAVAVIESSPDAAVWVVSVDVLDGGVVRWLQGDTASAGPAATRSTQTVLSWGTADSGREPWFVPSADGGPPALADLEPGPGSSDPLNFTNLGEQTLFTATTLARGREVWVTDGTVEHTRLVRDLHPGPRSSSPTSLVRLGHQVLFLADDGTSGTALWRTDGTEAGTTLVRDFAAGPLSSHPTALVVGETLAWLTADDGSGPRLWKTDGTTSGTVVCAGPGANPVARAASGNRVLITALDGTTRVLGITDGTAAGTVTLLSLGQATLERSVATSSHWFFATTEGLRRTVWATDGTVAGTHALWTGDRVREPWLLPVGEGVAFSAVSDAGDELWLGNGVDAGLLADVTPGRLSSWPGSPMQVGTRLIFTATGEDDDRELWRYLLPAEFDNSPPRITGQIVGEQLNGWYTGATTILFEVSDPDSPLTMLEGCDGGAVLSEGTVSFTCSATSQGGHAQQTLTVQRDTVPPRVTCPPDLSIEDPSDAGTEVLFDVAVADEVDPSPLLLVDPPAGHFPAGTTFVLARARDTAGLESSCSFRVTVGVTDEAPLPPTTKLKPSSCTCNEVDGFSMFAIVAAALALRRRPSKTLAAPVTITGRKPKCL